MSLRGYHDDAPSEYDDASASHDEIYEAYVFLAVLAGLVCCCCSTCIMRRLRQLSGYSGYLSAELTQPLINTADLERDAIFRNSMQEQGEDDWRCPVCAFLNRPRSPACDLCGLDKTEGALRSEHYASLARQACSSDSAHEAGGDDKPSSQSNDDETAPLSGTGTLELSVQRLSARQQRAARRGLWRREMSARGGVLRWRRAPPSPDTAGDGGEASEGKPPKTDSAHGQVAVMRANTQLAWAPADGHIAGGGDGGEADARNRGGRGEDAARAFVRSFEEGVDPSEIVDVSQRSFREKHLWFERQLESLQVPWADGHVRIEVRRSHLLEDSVSQLMAIEPSQMRQWMRLQFQGEPGIDVGGLEREWFLLVCDRIFAPEACLFRRLAADGTYHIDPCAQIKHPFFAEMYQFIGRLLGKALMEHQSLPASLSLPLYRHILGAPTEPRSELKCLDPELARNLQWLTSHDGIEALELDFTVTPDGEHVHELLPGGAKKQVTDANKAQYADLLARYHLLDAVREPLWHLMHGLFEVMPPDALAVFDADELELLFCGLPSIDVEDWSRHTEYSGEYRRKGARHPVIRWLWEVISDLSNTDRGRLLQFCTGTSRVPAQGFKALQRNDGKYQRFNVQSIPKSEMRFPRAHTCFNRLDLPVYRWGARD